MGLAGEGGLTKKSFKYYSIKIKNLTRLPRTRKSVAQCINQDLERPMIASMITRPHWVGIQTGKKGVRTTPYIPC